MKRDWDLIREILARIEASPTSRDVVQPGEFRDNDSEVVSYHIQLLEEAGLVKAIASEEVGMPLYRAAVRLTWEGHEFLDQIRADTMWNRTKNLLAEKGIGLSFETIKYAAVMLAKEFLGG